MSTGVPPHLAPIEHDATLRFRACVAEVLAHEGGYVDHPRDPGGCTNFGITRATLEHWRREPVTCAQVRAMAVQEARVIYRAQYWNGVRGDDLPAGVDLVVFDAAVNSGRQQSAKWLQRSLRVEDDGAIGPVTLRALHAVTDHEGLIKDMCEQRIRFLRSLRTWPTFGVGWTRRVESIRRQALRMAASR